MSTDIYPARYHYVLEITLNSKIYVCKHSTNKSIEKDRYVGSGDIIRRYIKMFGEPAKQKLLAGRRVLHECVTEQEAYDKEAEIVDWEFVYRKDTLNKRPGGLGQQTGYKTSEKTKTLLSNAGLEYWEDPNRARNQSDILKKHHEEHPETIQKMSDAMLKHYEDPKNRERQSKSGLKSYKENPERRKTQSINSINRYKDPEERARTKRHTVNAFSNKKAAKSVEFVDVLRFAFKQ